MKIFQSSLLALFLLLALLSLLLEVLLLGEVALPVSALLAYMLGRMYQGKVATAQIGWLCLGLTLILTVPMLLGLRVSEQINPHGFAGMVSLALFLGIRPDLRHFSKLNLMQMLLAGLLLGSAQSAFNPFSSLGLVILGHGLVFGVAGFYSAKLKLNLLQVILLLLPLYSITFGEMGAGGKLTYAGFILIFPAVSMLCGAITYRFESQKPQITA